MLISVASQALNKFETRFRRTEMSYCIIFSAVDHFKKQFAYLEEHYAKGSTGTPPERQHNSLPR